MAQKGDLLSVRQDIRVVDATIRDGGLCNDFRFDDKFIKDLYNANVKAGVDYMEFGYKASKEIFNEEDFGKWKFCNDADIRKIVGDNKTPLKIAVMADVGRTDFKKDIIAKKDSPIDLIRVATYINAIPAAVEMIEDAAKKGYETTINIMAVSKARTEDITAALSTLLTATAHSIPRSQDDLQTFTAQLPTSTASRSVFTLTTTSSLLLPTQLRL